MADRSYHHGDLRAVLLDGAERTLADRGTAAISLRELAREAGVSHAAPGRHFKDKQALLDALALSGFERLRAALERCGPEGADTETRLLSLARAYVGFALSHGALLDLMYARKHESAMSARLATAVSDILDLTLAPIVQGQADGEIIEGDPFTIAYTVVSTLHGLATLSTDDTVERVDEVLHEVVRTLLHGLTPR
ncbi:TetR/AcrR family transcriptional regulator [Nocardiopsis sp. MG754419]|uniref:TetR/AcrR family transcriptional regulator n=1 Tax=Nocardiopsis sp. MG754419 TaxID=2259865 RepID=UPI001BA90D21|nr:TetR/AcrR family transcriptional regulator [Nocardiopsis sp. MG754419]MBR8743505.1 TetR family transcriptional regulator [Nocardiopsis sp. MG754419]